jgi:hypothetical protein
MRQAINLEKGNKVKVPYTILEGDRNIADVYRLEVRSIIYDREDANVIRVEFKNGWKTRLIPKNYTFNDDERGSGRIAPEDLNIPLVSRASGERYGAVWIS